MSEERVARVYAVALYEAATTADTIERTGADLHAFAGTVAESRPLANVLFNPQIDTAARERVLRDVTRGGDKLTVNALHVLLEKGRLNLVAEIAQEYARLADESDEVLKVEVTTAIELEPKLEERLSRRLQEVTGRKPELSKNVDAGIIGGLVLRIGDVIIDGSLRSRLQQLQERLHRAQVRGGVS